MVALMTKTYSREGEALSTIEIKDQFLTGKDTDMFPLVWEATIRSLQLYYELEYPDLVVPWERRGYKW